MNPEPTNYNWKKHILILIVFISMGNQCANYRLAIEIESVYSINPNPVVINDSILNFDFNVSLPVLMRNPKFDSINYELLTYNQDVKIQIGKATLKFYDSIDWSKQIRHNATISTTADSFRDSSKIVVRQAIYRKGKYAELEEKEIGLILNNKR